ncbi:MAG TPA: hypothetical protein VI197_08430 [Polyangiaceae bacterium]
MAFGLAVACSDDGGGGDDDDDSPGTNTTMTAITATPTVTSATIGSVTAATNQAATSSTGSGGSTTGSAGAGGGGGAAGACEPDPASGLPLGSAGAAGGAGAPGVSYDDGFHFTDPDSVAAWRIKPVADCPECIPDATLEAGCGTLLMTANWPEAANAGTLKSTAELNATGDERWDLTGRTVTVRLRWTEGADVDNNGFDIYLELLDDDYSFFGPTLGETFVSGPDYLEFTATVPSAPEGDFDPATVRQINVRFDTKFWTDAEDPPSFSYDTTIFEIDAVVW